MIEYRFLNLPGFYHHENDFIYKVIESIEDNFENSEFKIELLAQKHCMSRTAFYRRVKMAVGLSPIDFVRKKRVEKAAELLQDGYCSIEEIGYKCGFSSPQYLSRVFRKVMGCTPTEYKRRMFANKKLS